MPGSASGTTGAGTGSARRTTAIAVAATTVGVLPVWLIGGLSVLMRDDLRLDEGQLGIAVAAFFLASAATSVPGGRVAERIGARGAIALPIVVTALVLAGLGGLVISDGTLTAAMLFAGAANGFLYPAVNLVLARTVTSGRGLAFGLKQSAIPSATLVAGAALPAVGGQLGWRVAFVAASGVAGALAIIVWRGVAQDGGGDITTSRAVRAPDRELLHLTLAAALGSGAGNAMAAFAVPSAVHGGMTPALAGAVLVTASALCIAARVVAGWWADHRRGTHLSLISAMLLGGASGLALLAWTRAPAPVVVVATAIAFTAGWGWAGLMNLTVVNRYPASPAAATGVLQVGVFGGAVVGPAMFGAIAVRTSYALAWSVLASASSVAAVLILASDRRSRAALGGTPKESSGNGA